MATLTVFVPTFNESQNIIGTLENLRISIASLKSVSVEILLIDDASVDDTVNLVRKWSERNDNIYLRIFVKDENSGLGNSYRLAIMESKSEFFIYVPGDNVITIEDLVKIFSKIGFTDIIVPHFGNLDQRSFLRLTISAFFTKLMSFFSGVKLPYFNGPVISRLNLLREYFPNLSGFSSQAEYLCRSIAAGASYETVLISNVERENGDSKAITPKNIILAAYCFIRVFTYCRLLPILRR